jgi:hypothetical protein
MSISNLCVYSFSVMVISHWPPSHCFLITCFFWSGTVISFNAMPNLDLTEPIATRIRHAGTSLRRTADPSLLVQSLLDLSA